MTNSTKGPSREAHTMSDIGWSGPSVASTIIPIPTAGSAHGSPPGRSKLGPQLQEDRGRPRTSSQASRIWTSDSNGNGGIWPRCAGIGGPVLKRIRAIGSVTHRLDSEPTHEGCLRICAIRAPPQPAVSLAVMTLTTFVAFAAASSIRRAHDLPIRTRHAGSPIRFDRRRASRPSHTLDLSHRASLSTVAGREPSRRPFLR